MSSRSLRSRLAFALGAFACTPTAPQPARSHAPPELARAHAPLEPAPTILAVTAPGSGSLELRASAIEGSWGSSGVLAVDAPVPYWAPMHRSTARSLRAARSV
jgi:hypothetical protein